MHLRRVRRPSDPAAGSIRVTVEVTVRRDGGEEATSESSSESSTTSMGDEVLMDTFTVVPSGRASALESAMPDAETETSESEATLEAISRDAFLGSGAGMVFIFPEPPPDFRLISIGEAERRSTDLMNTIVAYGRRLLSSEILDSHAKAIPKDCDDLDTVSPAVWMQRFCAVKEIDQPLFFILRDSLRTHTAPRILRRWITFRRHLQDAGQTIASLTRQAEERPRKQWTSLIEEFYFLLLEWVMETLYLSAADLFTSHNETLYQNAPALQSQFGSLELKLSALATVLRIYFYLWRLTRPNPTSCVQGYRRARRFAGIPRHLKQFYSLVAQEFAYMQDPSFGHFQSTERALVGTPVHIDSVTEPAVGDDLVFCSICQESHAVSDCVRPRNCQCAFGKACLEPILNRDVPFSNACPNCRVRLHEPLQWRPILSNGERGVRAGLLWALQANFLSLKRELQADPEPFTEKQRILGFVRRVMYGRWRG